MTHTSEKALRRAKNLYENDRFSDAAKILKSNYAENEYNPEFLEVYGLSLYRDNQWDMAIQILKKFTEVSSSKDHLPIIADCYRALLDYRQVAKIWETIKRSPTKNVVKIEGQIVAAGALADQGKLISALKLIDSGNYSEKNPSEYLLRKWYVIADLKERAGDVPGARALFSTIVKFDPELADVAERASALS